MNPNHYFPQLSQNISLFLKTHPKEYDPCLDALKRMISSDFKALTLESNPVTAFIQGYADAQLEFIIREYAGFSQEAIHFLVDALIRNHDWKQLYEEIQENIEEEKGKETRNIPHLEMMRQGYRQELGIETEDVEYSEVTQGFLKKMRKIFNNNDNAFSAGALVALEGTAIFEFHILSKIVREYAQRTRRDSLKESNVSLTALYIDGHKDFEIGHEAHLRNSIRPYIHQGNIHKMVRGYLNVCITMNTWWEQLAAESFRRLVQNMLKFEDVELFPVKDTFLS